MSCVVIVFGEIGSGKTTACLKLAERATTMHIPIGGILSARIYRDGELIGYDGLEPASNTAFPLVRLKNRAVGPDWFTFGHLKYSFSKKGFERANDILMSSAQILDHPSIVFVDEFGRLEKARSGIYPGAARITESLGGRGVVIFACRTDMVDVVEGLVKGRVDCIFRQEPMDVESLWQRVRGCLQGFD